EPSCPFPFGFWLSEATKSPNFPWPGPFVKYHPPAARMAINSMEYERGTSPSLGRTVAEFLRNSQSRFGETRLHQRAHSDPILRSRHLCGPLVKKSPNGNWPRSIAARR